ncbi:hypothetical protein E3A20_08980 [Planctomyces bekefii]|uniref:Uncharacterized protein n=1 Tax=Planctomyces bekefii TaxID=1653850 RepID=A0A5C6M746_9PLAN|nr:hypothetical protein E3A20_08980 [Planctomyces bekefii]
MAFVCWVHITYGGRLKLMGFTRIHSPILFTWSFVRGSQLDMTDVRVVLVTQSG